MMELDSSSESSSWMLIGCAEEERLWIEAFLFVETIRSLDPMGEKELLSRSFEASVWA